MKAYKKETVGLASANQPPELKTSATLREEGSLCNMREQPEQSRVFSPEHVKAAVGGDPLRHVKCMERIHHPQGWLDGPAGYSWTNQTTDGIFTFSHNNLSGNRALQFLQDSPVLAFSSSKSKMATPVVSLPVPAVVGTKERKKTMCFGFIITVLILLILDNVGQPLDVVLIIQPENIYKAHMLNKLFYIPLLFTETKSSHPINLFWGAFKSLC